MDRSCGVHEVVDKSWRLHDVIDRLCGIHEVMDRSWRLHEVIDRWWGVHEGVDTSCGIHKGVDGSWDLHEGVDNLKISTYIMYGSPSVPWFFLGFWGVLLYFFSLKQTWGLFLEQMRWNSKYCAGENGSRKSEKAFMELYLSMRKSARPWPNHGTFLTLVIFVFYCPGLLYSRM